MAKKYGYLATIGADTSGLTSALQESDNAIKKTESELREINKALKLDPTNTELIAQKYEVLGQQLDATRKKAKSLEQSQSDAAKAFANNPAWEKAYEPLNQQLIKAKENLKKLQDENEKMKNDLQSGKIDQTTYDEYTKSLTEAENAQKNVQKQIRDLKKEFKDMGGYLSAEDYRKYSRELEQARIAVSKLEKETQELDSTTNQSSKEFRKAVESTEEYQQALDKLNASAGEFKSKVGGALNAIWDIALKVGTALTSAAVAGGTAAVKIGSDFDSSMSKVLALSGAVGTEFDELREKAKEMGATTSKTAKESADALGYMALAGWDTQQMMEGLEPILRASEAGAMDLATASDLITDSMSAMGVSVNDLTHYLDVATKAQSSSNTSLEQLLNAYVVAGGSFKNFNVSLEESAALLGVLANRGIKGSEAGNALNSVLINLIGASGKSSEAMETLGVSAFDADGKFIGVTETLEQVSAALEKLDEEQRAVLTAQLGGKTQYDTLQALLSGVNEEYDNLLGKIEDSNGALEDAAKIMRDNLQGDITTLKSTLQDLGIEVNDRFTDAFREAVQVTTKEFAKLSNEVSEGELGESLQKIGSAFAKCIEQIAKFATSTGIPAVINFFEFIADNGELVKGIIAGIGSAFVAWKFSSIITGLNGIHTSFMKLKISAQESAAATQAFNNIVKTNIVKTNIYAAAASALIGMATALKTWLDTHSEVKNLLDETSQAIYDQTYAYKESLKTAEENVKTAEKNAAAAKKYWYEITKLVDEQGNARGSTDELNIAVAEFNKVAGTNIAVIDGQIQGYKDLSSTMNDYIDDMQRQAKLSYLSDSYGEALVNIDDTTKKYEEALKKREELNEDYLQKLEWFNEAQATGYSEHMPWEQLIKEKKEAEEAFDAAATEAAALEQAVMSYQSAIDRYNDILNETKKEEDNNGARIAAEGMIAEYKNKALEAANEIEENQAQIVENFQQKMNEIDYKKNTHQFADDTAYWSERRRVLNENINKESEEWWKYYDETEKYFADLTDSQKKAYEQQIENQVEALKERKELNDDFTDEMYYDELETIIAALDKESDLYKKYNSEILKGRKKFADDLDDETVKTAKEQAEALSAQFEKAYAEIKSKRDQLLNDFRNIELTETVKDKNGDDKLILKDLDAEIKRLDRYEASIDRLRKKGISDNLMAEIMNLDYASGTRQDYIDALLSIPPEKLEQYDRELNALKERQEEAADNAVAEARENTNKQAEKAMDDVTKMFSGMTKTAYEKGAETIENFYQGMIDSMRDVNDLGTISRVLDSVFSETSGKSGASGKAYSNGNGLTVGESYIAANTPIVINIDNKKYVEMTLNDIIDKGARSGGNPLHL